jgi:hypothetical protein
LYNVGSVSIDIEKGSFSHNSIDDGSKYGVWNDAPIGVGFDSGIGSVMAIGPCSNYNFTLSESPKAVVLGGGNLLYVTEYAQTNFLDINILSEAVALQDASLLTGTADSNDNGVYTLMSSTNLLRQRNMVGTAVANRNANAVTLTNGAQADFYRLLAMPPIQTETPSGYVALAGIKDTWAVAYVDGSQTIPTIVRTNNFAMAVGQKPDASANTAELLVGSQQADGTPNVCYNA